MEGYTISPDSARVLKRGIDDIQSLKQQIKQVQSQYLPGLPMEIFVPRSLASGIYTGDLYVYDPVSESLVLQLEDQTAELMPDSV